MRYTLFILMMLVLALADHRSEVHADAIILKNGGRVEGELVSTKSGNDAYVLKVPSVGHIKFSAQQVRNVVRKTDAEKEYARRSKLMQDQLDQHVKAAKWCSENGLRGARLHHLQQVLRHDPDHEPARRALGYVRFGRDKQWMKQDEMMQRRGYVRDGHTWKLGQQIQIDEAKKTREKEVIRWRKDINRWKSNLNGKRDAEARRNIKQIRDPAAAPVLAKLVANEERDDVRRMYIEVLSKLKSGAAINSLIVRALDDPDRELRVMAIDALKKNGSNVAIPVFTQRLGSKENRMINRAAYALGRLNAQSAVLPLIDVLKTKHTRILKKGGNMSIGFGSNGAQGMSMGGGPKRETKILENESVLNALLSITDDVNFQYSQPDWMNWYVAKNSHADVNLRRDN